MLTTEALTGLGAMWRGDWSEFDGRTLRDQLNGLALLIDREAKGEDVRAEVFGWCDVWGVERPASPEDSERETRLRELVRGYSSEEEAGQAPGRYLWLCTGVHGANWHTTHEPEVDITYRGLPGWTIRGVDLDTGEPVA